jgi:hypothetical protein
MPAGQNKSRLCMLTDRKIGRDKSVFMVARFTGPPVLSLCKLTSMGIFVTVTAPPKPCDMKSPFAAGIFPLRIFRMTVLALQSSVFALQRKLRFRMIECSAFDLMPRVDRVTAAAFLPEFPFMRVGMTRPARIEL